MTDYVTPTTWEQCAAHVEAGGIVEVFDGFDEWLDEGVGPSGFRSRPRGPGIGTWEAPRRLVPIETEAYRKERRAIDVPDGYEAVWLPSETVDEFGAGEDDRVSRGHVVAGAREAQARRGTTPAPPPAPSPVPPWPGAVLSGLTDEDGVPTWLAQAGQVRGEQVRKAALSRWTGNIAYGSDQWVEVRAPRTVPEPETERVPWWEAVGREVTDQDGERVTIEHVQCGDGAGPSVTAYNAAERRDTSLLRVPILVRGDGTVEVLVEAGQ